MSDPNLELKPGQATLRVLASPARKNKANNPFNCLLYDAMPAGIEVFEFATTPLNEQHWDILHLHWPDLMLRHNSLLRIHIKAWTLLRKMAEVQRRGGKVVWTAHNVEPHKMPLRFFALRLWHQILHTLDGVIYLNGEGQKQLQELYPSLRHKPSAIIPHGHYIGAYPPCNGTPFQQLGIERGKTNLLFFGKIRFHKGLSSLLEAFGGIQQDRANLIIAGQPDEREQANIGSSPYVKSANVKTLLRHIQDTEVSGLFQVADAVILPYRNILNSGTAILALSMQRPIVAPRVGSLPELQKTYGENWVFLYDQPLTPQVLEKVLDWLSKRETTALDLSQLNWEIVARQTADFYRQLVDTAVEETPTSADSSKDRQIPMKTNIKKWLKNVMPGVVAHYRAYQSLLLRRKSYLRQVGWLNSIKLGYPCDNDGSPLPWMNYAIIAVCKDRIAREHTIFEYGSGYSTLFFAQRAKSIVAVEYDRHWFEHLSGKIPANARLIFQKNDIDGDYCRTILSTSDSYDIVIVDGRDRVNCVKQGLKKLSAQGVMLLDDSHREEYIEGINYAKGQGFKILSFTGLKPLWHKGGTTTLIYRAENCLQI